MKEYKLKKAELFVNDELEEIDQEEKVSEKEKMIRNERPKFDSQIKSTTVFGTANKYTQWKDKV